MENIMFVVKSAFGGICAVIAYLFGGTDTLFTALLAMVALDYVSGLLVAVYHDKVSSDVGFKGIIKKACLLLIVAISHLIGSSFGFEDIRSFVIGFFLANEAISILENVGNMGVKLPQKLMDVLEQIKGKDEK